MVAVELVVDIPIEKEAMTTIATAQLTIDIGEINLDIATITNLNYMP